MSVTGIEQDVAATLAAAVDWLYRVEQPHGAVPQLVGYQHRVGERVYAVCSHGAHCRPVIVVRVVKPEPADGWALNNVPDEEMTDLAAVVRDLGGDVMDRFASNGSKTLCLAQRANGSLLRGMERYYQGCPDHHTVVCAPELKCGWLRDALALTVPPAWPSAAT